MHKRPILSIVIPCLNEKETIIKVVEDARQHAAKFFKNDFEIVIADNGSTDGSLEIIQKISHIKLVKVPVRGYGAALHWGILSSSGNYVLFADADQSYPFSNLSKFKDSLLQSPDLVLGSRMTGTIEDGAMPFLNRYLGTPMLTLLIRWLYKIPVTDCNSGMRLVKRDFYNGLNMRNSGMEWASELLLKTALKKGKYLEVQIAFKKDSRNRTPHLSRWSDGWRHLKAILLLKPQSLYILTALFGILAILLYHFDFSLTFLFLLLLVEMVLSLFTLDLLKYAIEGTSSPVSIFLNNFTFVPIVSTVSLLLGLGILIIPNEHLGTKLFLSALIGVIFIWVFLVETIKTHLVNRLPDVEKN